MTEYEDLSVEELQALLVVNEEEVWSARSEILVWERTARSPTTSVSRSNWG